MHQRREPPSCRNQRFPSGLQLWSPKSGKRHPGASSGVCVCGGGVSTIFILFLGISTDRIKWWRERFNCRFDKGNKNNTHTHTHFPAAYFPTCECVRECVCIHWTLSGCYWTHGLISLATQKLWGVLQKRNPRSFAFFQRCFAKEPLFRRPLLMNISQGI